MSSFLLIYFNLNTTNKHLNFDT